MIVYDQKEADTQPPNWLNLAEVLAWAIVLIAGCKQLWHVLILIVEIETAVIYTLGDLVYFVLFCITINTILFYVGLMVCKD